MAGKTSSYNFPTAGVASSNSGGYDAFLARLNSQGTALVFSRYLGGSGSDMANAIALDATGNCWLAGETKSANFPMVAGFQTQLGGGSDAFLTKLSPAGAVLSSTYLGGVADDAALALALDAQQRPVAVGSTWSPDFPLRNPLQATPGGAQDAFVTKLAADGGSLEFSTYLGGSQGTTGFPEWATSVGVGNSGDIYVGGVTSSSDFPRQTPYQPAFAGGSYDGFFTILNGTGSAIQYSTYLGGAGNDSVNGIAVDGFGNVLLAGVTSSTNFPVSSAYQQTKKALQDAFVAKFAADGSTLWFSTFFGGSAADGANAIAAAPDGGFVIAGQTGSYDLPLSNPYQSTNYGTLAAFVARFSDSTLPAVVSLAPSAGDGSIQVFTAQYAHTGGASKLAHLYLMAQAGLVFPGACQIRYNVSLNGLYLRDDADVAWLGPIAPGSGSTLENTQCRLYGSGSSSSLSGSYATLRLAVEFKTAFAGTRDLYLRALDVDNGDSGWKEKGIWNVPSEASPAAMSASPLDGSSGGQVQSFTFQYAHPSGAAWLGHLYGMIHSAAINAGGCQFRYNASLDGLFLMNDQGTAWLGAIAPGSSATLENAQCRIVAASSAVTLNGVFLTVRVGVQFKNAFAGGRFVYGRAIDKGALDTGWEQFGGWTVVQTNEPTPVSVSPSSGASGASSQTFTFEYSHGAGYASFTHLYGMFHTSTGSANGCQLRYNRTINGLFLLNDAGTAWLGAIAPGSGSTLENSQCRLIGSSSSVYASGTVLRVAATVQFKTAFAGTKNIYMRAADSFGVDSGWVQKGTWDVTSSESQIWGGVTPSSGSSGLGPQTYLFEYVDPAGFANMGHLFGMLWNGTSMTNACQFRLNQPLNGLFLMNDANTVWLGPVAPGTGAVVENSQCRVIASQSAAVGSGANFLLLVTVEFKPSFVGGKFIESRMMDVNRVDTGWLRMGSWTILAVMP